MGWAAMLNIRLSILALLGAGSQVMPYAMAYTRIYIIFSIFNVFNVTMNNIVSSEGAAKTTMCVLIAGAVINVALDPVFIYVLDMGVAGAAIATAMSQLISALAYLYYIFSKKSVFTFRLKKYCLSKEIMGEILKIGIPTLAFQLLASLSMSMINDRAQAYGDSVLAAMGAVTKIMSLGSMMVFGFLKGLQPIAGYSWGGKKYGRLNKAIKISILWSTVFCVIFGLTAALFAAPVISLFTKNDGEMIHVGAAALRANGLSFILFGFYTVYSFLFLAMGKAKEGCFLGTLRQGICFIPVIYSFPVIWRLNGIIYAQPAADALSAVITAFMAVQFHRKLLGEKALSMTVEV